MDYRNENTRSTPFIYCIMKISPVTASCALLLLLSACGGGGGDGGGAVAAIPSVAPAPAAPLEPSGSVVTRIGDVAPTDEVPAANDSTLVTSVPAATYGAGSEEAAAFAYLNAERLRCGFGLLAQDSKLDVAAAGHANFLLINNYAGHGQPAGLPGFTGAGVVDRYQAAGYQPSAALDENVLTVGSSSIAGAGVKGIKGLLSAPYHLSGLLQGMRDIGLSIMSSDTAGSTASNGKRFVTQINMGNKVGVADQLPASASVLTYPCAGTSGTFARLLNETPNPIPGRDLAANPIGHPVFVGIRSGILTVSTALMQEVATGNTVTLRPTMTSANDPNKSLNTNEALVIPDVGLKTSTVYKVMLTGANNAQPFTKEFTFTTGAVAN